MKRLFTIVLLLFVLSPVYAQDDLKTEAPKTSTYYFIRHAEKNRTDKTDRDPHLIEKGQLRAAKWSFVLENVSFDAVYSTNYNRTRETAQPTAEKSDLEITFYDPRNIDAKTFLETTKGQNVLVVGHSNTTPMFVNAVLGKEKYPQIDDANNANLYIVTVSGSGEISDVLIVID